MTQSTSPDTLAPLDKIDTGATVVITHKVSHHNTPAYEAWLTKIRETVTQAQGFLDSQVIRPVAGLTETYTVILRFDTIAHLTAWMHSDTRNRLIEEVTPILRENEDYHIKSGLEFLFADALPATAQTLEAVFAHVVSDFSIGIDCFGLGGLAFDKFTAGVTSASRGIFYDGDCGILYGLYRHAPLC